uniref:DUF4794 domain-containing protein n=1 Tax=Glossina austeni TaxID=7395 RepID=A0A1A9UQJ1_GLOAU
MVKQQFGFASALSPQIKSLINNMKSFFSLWLMTMAGSLITAIPIRVVNPKLSSRQKQFSASPSSLASEQIGYPEAGFRPSIPFELPTERTPKAVIKNMDDITRRTTTLPEIGIINMSGTVYGLPEELDDVFAIDAEVIPIPAEGFQLPHPKSDQNFISALGNGNSLDTDAIADLPAAEQTSSTKNENKKTKQDPLTTYGAPDLNLTPKKDVETVIVEQMDENNSLEQQAASEAWQIPAETYGVPELPDLNNELKGDLAEVGVQFTEILNPTNGKSGRLVLLPLQSSLYLGRLVLKPWENQRPNGSLSKL